MRNHERRLSALEQRFPAGCDVCRGWQGMVLSDDTGHDLRPETCPQCGRRVPIVARVVLSGIRLATI